jgi:hypothetical protein
MSRKKGQLKRFQKSQGCIASGFSAKLYMKFVYKEIMIFYITFLTFLLLNLFYYILLPYRTVRYRYATGIGKVANLICSYRVSCACKIANHLFYRFRTVFRVQYAIRPWYESRVRPVSPSNFLLPRLRASDLRAR